MKKKRPREGIRALLARREPLEFQRLALLDKLKVVNEKLAAIGKPSASNAAIHYIAEHPGSSTWK